MSFVKNSNSKTEKKEKKNKNKVNSLPFWPRFRIRACASKG